MTSFHPIMSCPLGIPLFHPSPPYAEPAFLPYSRLSVTCLVHVGQPCSFVVLALCLLHIDVFVPGSLFTYRCTLPRELVENSSQNGRQIFVLVFAESRSSLEKCRNGLGIYAVTRSLPSWRILPFISILSSHQPRPQGLLGIQNGGRARPGQIVL